MQNIIRHLTKSKADKQAELISAYLDQALPARARQQFQQALAHDADLQAEVRQQQAVKAAIRQLPRRRAPRSFTLDPARYGRAQLAPTWQPFPVLRAATAMMALLLMAVLAFDLGVVQRSGLSQPASTAMTQVEAESFAAETVEEAAAPAAAEVAPPAEEPVAEARQMEATAADTVVVTEEALMETAAGDDAAAADAAAPAAALSQSDSENSLGMAQVLTETMAATETAPPLESAPAPLTAPIAAPTIAAPLSQAATAVAAVPTATTSAAPALDLAPTPPAARPTPALSSRSLFLITEIFLGAAVLALSLAAWLVRRRS